MASRLWQRVSCCLTGHDYVIASERSRMFLRCRTCGRTSRGLELSESPFRNRTRTSSGVLRERRAASSQSHFATR